MKNLNLVFEAKVAKDDKVYSRKEMRPYLKSIADAQLLDAYGHTNMSFMYDFERDPMYPYFRDDEDVWLLHKVNDSMFWHHDTHSSTERALEKAHGKYRELGGMMCYADFVSDINKSGSLYDVVYDSAFRCWEGGRPSDRDIEIVNENVKEYEFFEQVQKNNPDLDFSKFREILRHNHDDGELCEDKFNEWLFESLCCDIDKRLKDNAVDIISEGLSSNLPWASKGDIERALWSNAIFLTRGKSLEEFEEIVRTYIKSQELTREFIDSMNKAFRRTMVEMVAPAFTGITNFNKGENNEES